MDSANDSNGDDYHTGPVGPIELRYEIGVDEKPSQALVNALARIRGLSPTDMAPLYTRVDLESLDALLGSTTGRPRWSACSVAISLQNHELVINNDEILVIRSDCSGQQVSSHQ